MNKIQTYQDKRVICRFVGWMALGMLNMCLMSCMPFKSLPHLKSARLLSSGAGGKFACSAPVLRGTTDPTLRRLTRFEYENSLRDIFGSDVVATVSASLSGYPDDVFNKSVSEFNVNHSSSAVNTIVTVGSAIAETVAANSTYLQRIAPACLFDTTGEITFAADSCTQNFISAVGLKIYRRPLSAAEVSTYLTTLKTPTTAATSNSESVAILLGQMLLQPEMIFHFAYSKTLVESRYKLDPYTVASRLSYRVIGTAPDDTLLAAAQNGQLGSTQLLQAQALRLFQKTVPSAQSSYIDNPGRRFVRHFYSQWLSMPLARSPDINYASIFGVSQGGLKNAIIGEAMTFGEYITMDSAGDFNDLMNSNMAFPPTADVAKIMGTDVSAGASDPKPVSDSRRGLFERPILMLDETTRESPEHRGAQFLRMATCTDLGDPPPNANAVATQVTQTLDTLQMTDGQIAKAVTSSQECMGCHAQINPPGFLFETFGPFGEYRTKENTYDLNNNLVASLPINPSTVVSLDGTPVAMSGPDILGPTLANSIQAKACMAQELFRLTRFRVEATADACQLSDVETVIRSGANLMNAFSTNAATEDLLWENAN